jgi:putative transposase
MIDFKGTHCPKDVILFAIFFYLRYPVSYRDLEEILEERGVDVDHGTLNGSDANFCDLSFVG